MSGDLKSVGEMAYRHKDNFLRSQRDPKKFVVVLGCHKPRTIGRRSLPIQIGCPSSVESDFEDSFDGKRVWKPYPSSPVFPYIKSQSCYPPPPAPLLHAQSSSSCSRSPHRPVVATHAVQKFASSKEPGAKKFRKETTGCAILLIARRVGRWFQKVVRRAAAKMRNKCPPRLKTGAHGVPGAQIRDAAVKLASNTSSVFAQNIDNFISCTRESKETRPQVVMRNMRQFMSGMKNYLAQHGEKDFDVVVERERNKLKSNEFLNLDAILEGVMHEMVVHPLRDHLYRLFVDEYSQTGAIQLLADNIQYARNKTIYELGVRARITPPSEKNLETISHFLNRLQEVDSPLEKLENLLACISAIINSVKSANAGRGGVTLGADDFLPLFVWVLIQCRVISAEIEAEYMWGLLHPSLLSGEGGYYLTTLSSAVHVLKNFRACSQEQAPTVDMGLKIVVPDELHGSIITKVLPVRPNMSTRDVCKIIAHKARITNPQDYGLYTLVDGDETLLSDTECPQDVKSGMQCIGKHVMFAYKRIDAKIAWPRSNNK